MPPTAPSARTHRAVVVLAALTAILSLSAATAATAAAPATTAESVSARQADGKRLVPRGWPNRRTTGAKGDLRSVDGRTVTKDGAVLEDLEVSGTLTIRADNVTLHNVRVLADSYYGILIYGRNTVIRRSSVLGTNRRVMAGIAVIEGNVRARRVKVRGVEDGVRLGDNSSLRRSLIYRLRGDSGSHYDSVTADGHTGWRIIHNTILNRHTQTAAVWAGDERYDGSEGVLRRNYLAGGGYTIYAGPGTGKGIRVLDNRFSTRYYRDSGYWGVITDWESDGNTWSGNRWADGRREGRRVRP